MQETNEIHLPHYEISQPSLRYHPSILSKAEKLFLKSKFHHTFRYDSHLLVGSICLTFQVIKGICLLIASVSNINRKVKEKKRRIKHHYQTPTSTEKTKVEKTVSCISNDKGEILIVPTICIQDTSDDTPKKVLDPMKPAYNFNDGLV